MLSSLGCGMKNPTVLVGHEKELILVTKDLFTMFEAWKQTKFIYD